MVRLTTPTASGTEMILLILCGLSGVLVPFCASVPCSLHILLGLLFVVSTLTLSVSNNVESTFKHRSINARPSLSFRTSTRYNKWYPLPEAAKTGAGNPMLCRYSLTFFDKSKEIFNSSSLEEMPAGRTGSKSINSHLYLMISVSLVVDGGFFSKRSHCDLAKHSGFTWPSVTYTFRPRKSIVSNALNRVSVLRK